MRAGPPKIKDVAALAGVSVATVSRALNDNPTVDPVMVDRVRNAALTLGYRTNALARSLRRQRADVWALIISDINQPFFTSVARGVEDVAQSAGFAVFLCNSDEDPVKEERYLDLAERERVSGVILSPNRLGSDVSRLAQSGVPVIAIDKPLNDSVDTVLTQSREGARAATAHLLEQGYSNPACVTGPSTGWTAEQRLAGYKDALRERGLRVSRNLIRRANYRAASARQAVASMLDLKAPPDALFMANSEMALGALDELQARGLVPGRDIGLIMFDDPPWAGFLTPPLSVVVQPSYELGRHAAEILLERIRSKPGRDSLIQSPSVVVLPTELIVRGSSLLMADSRPLRETVVKPLGGEEASSERMQPRGRLAPTR